MKSIALLVLFALSARASLGPHPVKRTLMRDEPTAVIYKDKMSDGTYRDSRVDKPKMPEYPNRITLVATNSTPCFFELVYESVYEGGRKATNFQAVLKDKRDIIKSQLTLPPMPKTSTNAPAKTDAFGWGSRKILTSAVTNKVHMAPQQQRTKSVFVVNGKILRTMTDGSTRIEALRTAHTARVTTVPANATPNGILAQTAVLAAAAAAGAAVAGLAAKKKAKG